MQALRFMATCVPALPFPPKELAGRAKCERSEALAQSMPGLLSFSTLCVVGSHLGRERSFGEVKSASREVNAL